MAVKRTRPYRSEARAASADETRTNIIKSARRLLAGGKGVPKFSVDAVARDAGITRLTIYNQFTSKQGLLEAVFDDMAQQGGLHELASVFTELDMKKALRRFVSIFCNFWSMHGKVMPKFSAVAKLDAEIALSLKQRTERRRKALSVLTNRFADIQNKNDFVDVVFALTSFEMFEALSESHRSNAAAEALIWQLVDDSMHRFTEKRRNMHP